jgi:hypothetical protein
MKHELVVDSSKVRLSFIPMSKTKEAVMIRIGECRAS